ncbi:MAG: hypothetical protein GKS02_10160 [Alphaproteobacteria bacterium]|nr:hypothetical protein [Alphaproteobacteria bacterium]
MKRVPPKFAFFLAVAVIGLLYLGPTNAFAREPVNKQRLFQCIINDASEVGKDGNFKDDPFSHIKAGDRLWYNETNGILRVAESNLKGFELVANDTGNALVATRTVQSRSRNSHQVMRINTSRPVTTEPDDQVAYSFLYVGDFSVLFAGLCTIAN